MNFSGTRNSNNISPSLPGGNLPTRAVSSSTTNNNTSVSRGNVPGNAASSSSISSCKYVYDLPFFDRKEFCRIFDENNQWETLGGGLMGYSSSECSEFGRAIFRGSSPTDSLLTSWGSQNHTILELFTLCGRLCHYRAMSLLARFVDQKYHHYIRDPTINVTAELVQIVETNPSPIPSPIGEIKVQNIAPEKPSSNENDDKQAKSNEENKVKLAESAGLLPHIPFQELLIATNTWERRNILGKGGFGTVFKGIWKNTAVAIKRMENRATPIQAQRKQSLEELKFLNSYRHDNILPLYGYCMEGEHPLCLIYQYMPHGSLEDRLLCRQKSTPLNWSTRFNITRGVACGIQFLHSIGAKPLIHGDIKSANILLDKNYEAKVGDFGLAREMNIPDQPGGASYVKVSRVHGTRPYLPDEYLRSKKLSTKVDTFSFGIMLFEIITGQRAYEETRQKKFLKEIFDEVENVEILKDPRAGSDNPDIFWIFIKLAKFCTQRLAKERPEMFQVLKSLDGMMSQATSLRTVSSHVTGLPFLFETRPASLMPTGTSTTHRLSPVEMRTPSPHWTPGSNQQQQLQHQTPKHQLLDSVASARRSPIPSPITTTTSTNSTQPPHSIPIQQQMLPSPQTAMPNSNFMQPPLQPTNTNTNQTISSNSNASNPPYYNNPTQMPPILPASVNPTQTIATNQNSSLTEDEEAIPTTINQHTNNNKKAQALPIILSHPTMVDDKSSAQLSNIAADDDFLPLVLIPNKEEAQESSEVEEPMTVIPLITELGIKD